MRVLQWAFPYLPTIGGREIFIQRMSRSLLQRGHVVHVIAPPPRPNEFISLDAVEADEFPVLRHNMSMVLLTKDENMISLARRELIRDLKEIQPEIVHIHTNGPEVVFLRDALRSANIRPKIIYTHHGISEETTFWRYTLSMVSTIVAISQYSFEELACSNPEVSQKLIMIKNGVPIPDKTLPLNGKMKSVLAFGRLSEEKGFDILLEAWAKLHPAPNELKLTIMGDGLMAKELQRQARVLEIAHVVEFTGWASQEQIRGQIDSARLVVMPSIWNEPFGLAAAEAQSRARPVIASDVGGLSEIIHHSKTGILVPPANAIALSAALESLIHNVEALKFMGQQGYSRVNQYFNWEKCVDQYEELYKELTNNHV